MALLNKTGITEGGTIQAEHVTRTIDALTGVSTDTIVATGSFSGTLAGTSSFATSASISVSSSRAVSSSFATTASYALNAVGSGTEYATLTFFHSMKTNTTSGSVNYIGGVPTAPFSNASRIGLYAPFDGTIISGSATSYTTTQGAATVKVSLARNGTLTEQISPGLDLNSFLDNGVTALATNVTVGDFINIQLREDATTSAVYGINVVLQLKKT